MKTQITASAFWALFESDLKYSAILPPEEALRHSAILGFTSIDAAINTYWHEVIVADWFEHMSLVNSVLEDEEEMAAICNISKDYIKKSQVVATLRFISHTGEIEKFSPNFLDLALMCLLKFGEDQSELASELTALQQYRNSALHTGREWSELTARKCINNIKTCSTSLIRLHPCFADVFEKTSQSVSKLKQVA